MSYITFSLCFPVIVGKKFLVEYVDVTENSSEESAEGVETAQISC